MLQTHGKIKCVFLHQFYEKSWIRETLQMFKLFDLSRRRCLVKVLHAHEKIRYVIMHLFHRKSWIRKTLQMFKLFDLSRRRCPEKVLQAHGKIKYVFLHQMLHFQFVRLYPSWTYLFSFLLKFLYKRTLLQNKHKKYTLFNIPNWNINIFDTQQILDKTVNVFTKEIWSKVLYAY